MNQEEFDRAEKYDRMINWKTRLERELPLLESFLPKGRILDLACASGRHSLALQNVGYECLGIDVSEAMISIAKRLAEKEGSSAIFMVEDLTLPGLKNRLEESGYPASFDGAILLGNAIANMASLEAATNLLTNVHTLLKHGGRLVMHTINRPRDLHYIPLRRLNQKTLVQRIMVPVTNQSHNAELRVNFIDTESLNYLQQSSSPLYMFTFREMEALLTKLGFKILHTFGGFDQSPSSEKDGHSVVWVAEIP